MLEKKWFKNSMIILAFAIVLYLFAACISVRFFRSLNPIRSAVAVIQIMFTDINYAQVQEYPDQNFLIKTKNIDQGTQELIAKHITPSGFAEKPEEQMGGMRYFENDTQIALMVIQGNKYYMRCSIEYFNK